MRRFVLLASIAGSLVFASSASANYLYGSTAYQESDNLANYVAYVLSSPDYGYSFSDWGVDSCSRYSSRVVDCVDYWVFSDGTACALTVRTTMDYYDDYYTVSLPYAPSCSSRRRRSATPQASAASINKKARLARKAVAGYKSVKKQATP